MKLGNWYRFGSASADDPSVASIDIIDFIGDWYDDAANRFWGENIGLTARAFVEALAALPAAVKTINVHINSPGGDVQAGINIANALRAEQAKGRTVVTHIDGVAASIASVIAMAGQRVVMADNALLMIHDPMTVAVGNAAELSKALDFLGAAKDQIVATYKWHATAEDDAIRSMMSAETWMGADEALALGFVTDKVEGLKAQATLSRASVAKLHVPEQHRATIDALIAPAPVPPAPAPEPAPFDAVAVVNACVKAGLPELAEGLVGARASLDQVTARIDRERADRAAATARAEDIRAVCAMARLPELADAYISGGMPIESVRAQLTVVKAKLDGIEIDGSLPVEDSKKARAQVSASWDAAFARITH